jgi:3-hydroxyacyl-[acyl-carrier-protein] dehydratase
VRTPQELPHAYPFRFVETVLEARDAEFSRGTVGVAVSANGRAAAGEAWQSPLLLAEAIAQSALLLEGGDPEMGRTGFLAGLDGFRVDRLPRAGEMLEVRVRLSARFGAIVKFEGEVFCGSESLARGSVLVRKGTSSAAP